MKLRPWLILVLVAASCGADPGEVGGESSTTSSAAASTTTAEAASTTTESATSTTQSTTTTMIIVDEVNGSPAWTAAEAERDVENYLAALAAGAYDQAGWTIENNDGAYDGQGGDESPAEYLARLCAAGACLGPYGIAAEGPGLFDGESGQAASLVTVTHLESGRMGEVSIGTHEGQRIVMGLPPLVPSAGAATLVAQLFGDDLPERVVAERFNAFEIWDSGGVEWVTNWWADGVAQVEGNLLVSWPDLVVDLLDPTLRYPAEYGYLTTRGGEVLLVEDRWSDSVRVTEVRSGEGRSVPIQSETRSDGEYVAYWERAGVVVSGIGDAEGNLISLVSDRGVDLAGDDYIGILALSVDGSKVAYVDHGDTAAYSHFWSPVVVVKDVTSGSEIGRYVVDGPVLCLEFSGHWVLACVGRSDLSDLASGMPEQAAVTAINIDSGVLTRVETRTRVFLPS